MFSLRRTRRREKISDTPVSDPGRRSQTKTEDGRSNVTVPPPRSPGIIPPPRGIFKRRSKLEVTETAKDELMQAIKEHLEKLKPDKVLLGKVNVTEVKRALQEMYSALEGLHGKLAKDFIETQQQPTYPGWDELYDVDEKMAEAVLIAEDLLEAQSESQSQVQSQDGHEQEFNERPEPSAPPRSALDDFLGDDEEQMPILFAGGMANLHGSKKNSEVPHSRLRFSDRRQEFGPTVTSTPFVGAETGAIPKARGGTQAYAARYPEIDDVSPDDSISAAGERRHSGLSGSRRGTSGVNKNSSFSGASERKPVFWRDHSQTPRQSNTGWRSLGGGLPRRGPPGGGPPSGGPPGGGPPSGPPGSGPPGGGFPGGPPGGGYPGYPNFGNITPNLNQGGQSDMAILMSHMMMGMTTAIRQGLHSSYHVKDKVQKFTGQGKAVFSKYSSWREAILKQVEYLLSVNKCGAEILQEIKNTLGGPALSLINDLELTDGNFEVAMSLLDEMYMDPFLLVDSLIEKMLDIPSLNEKSSLDQWWQFYADIISVRQRFQQLQLSDADISTVFFQHSIVQKLSPALQKAWRKKRTIYQQSLPKGQFQCIPVDLFFRMILQEIKASQTVHQDKPNKGQEKSKPNKPNFRNVKGLTYTVAEGSTNNVQCRTCDNDKKHSLSSCKAVKAMSHTERWNRLKSKKICAGCQIPLDKIEHKVRDCHERCTKCGRGHNVLFHDDNFYKQKSPKGKRKKNSANVHATSGECETQVSHDGSSNE